MSEEQREHTASGGGGGGGSARHGGGNHGGHSGGHEEGHEGAPEWLISFADNVVLQMGFFVILLALTLTSVKSGAGGTDSGEAAGGPTAEQLDWAIAVREAFNNPVDLHSTDPRDLLLVRRLRARRGLADADSLGQKGADHDVKSIRPSDYFGWGGTVPFAQESSVLDEAGKAALAEMLEHLRGDGSLLEIRGHASAAEACGKADRGAGLSYERRAGGRGSFGSGRDRLEATARAGLCRQRADRAARGGRGRPRPQPACGGGGDGAGAAGGIANRRPNPSPKRQRAHAARSVGPPWPTSNTKASDLDDWGALGQIPARHEPALPLRTAPMHGQHLINGGSGGLGPVGSRPPFRHTARHAGCAEPAAARRSTRLRPRRTRPG